ncbi:hypothetical protein PHYBOEH_003776 [Phytophthora boehmeriae]|uniref:RxLR effector protein n=1 Tax=Phytophthora boehmeriae TaxID=109152 RepID=A0A8T1WNC9_9STRA|nr:hypothetical protein PHYBOEH_003776 [Phytophthora boehmeriae]
MGGLSGAALKNHKNYKNFQKFKYQKEGSILDNYVYKDVPTFDVWTKLGLDKLPKNKIQTAPEYRTYERYVNKYADDYLWFPGDHKLKFTGTPEEKTAKAEIWAKKRRPKYMVKEMLGLKDMKKKERQNDPDYEYYALFLKLSGEK